MFVSSHPGPVDAREHSVHIWDRSGQGPGSSSSSRQLPPGGGKKSSFKYLKCRLYTIFKHLIINVAFLPRLEQIVPQSLLAPRGQYSK